MNQVVSGLSLLIGRLGLRIENMKVDVSFDHLGHKSIHGASAGGNVMQHIRALSLLVKRPLDRVYLASDSSYAIEQFLFFFRRVSHKKVEPGLDRHTPAGIR